MTTPDVSRLDTRIGDPPPWHTVHHAIVMQRSRTERVILLCQSGNAVALVRGLDVAEVEPGTVLMVRVWVGNGDDDGTAHVLQGGEWREAAIEWVKKVKTTLVLPTPVSSP